MANGWSTLLINSKPVFSSGPRRIPRNLLDCIFLGSWIFDNFLLAEARAAQVTELFAKTSWRFVTYLSVSNVLWGKSIS